MRAFNPVENTGAIFASAGAFLGTCFTYRYLDRVLTASHVLGDRAASELLVRFPSSRASGRDLRVLEIHRHPSADMAIMRIDALDESDTTFPLVGVSPQAGVGLDVITYGYPEEIRGQATAPVARLLKGHVQRFFQHQHGRFEFLAMELSFGCPSGLSGALLVAPTLHGQLYGLVTGNIEVATDAYSYSEVEENGNRFTERTHKVINYGVGLWLVPFSRWLDQFAPPVPDTELSRRAKTGSP